jgi:hypothetical protein
MVVPVEEQTFDDELRSMKTKDDDDKLDPEDPHNSRRMGPSRSQWEAIVQVPGINPVLTEERVKMHQQPGKEEKRWLPEGAEEQVGRPDGNPTAGASRQSKQEKRGIHDAHMGNRQGQYFVAGGREDETRSELQPRTNEATVGPIKPATGPLKVQVQIPEAADEILDPRSKQKKNRGRPCKAYQEKRSSQSTISRTEDQPLWGPGDLDPGGGTAPLVLGGRSVSDQGSLNYLDSRPYCSNYDTHVWKKGEALCCPPLQFLFQHRQ